MDGRRCEPPKGSAPPAYEPPPPPKKTFLENGHALLAFHYGFAGSLEKDGQEGGSSSSTLGFNLRSDSPVAGYVLLGPMLQMGAWNTSEAQGDRSFYFDLDFVLRLRYPIMTPKFNYQVWVGMPVGLTIDVLGYDVNDVATVGLGWNIGVLFGGAVHLTPKFGLFAEGGWLQHRFSHSGGEVQDRDIALQQWILNLGIIVRN